MNPAIRRFCLGSVIAAGLAAGGCSGDEAKVEITFWQFWDVKVIEPLVEEFEKLNPGVEVKVEQLTWKSGLEKIQAAVASGTQPDLCELGSTWLPRFSYEGLLEDLTPVYEEVADSFMMWESARWNGRIYGLPWVQGSRVLFYNRDLFKRCGLDPDDPPNTWSELLHYAGRINALGEGISGFGLNVGERYVLYKKFMAFAWGNGGRIISEDRTRAVFDSPEVLEALRFYLKLAKYSLREKQEVLDHAFKKGRLGMQISGAWNLKNYALEAPDLDFGLALVPRPDREGGTHGSFAGAEILVVFENSRVKKEAGRLARFLHAYPRAKRLSREVGSVFPASKRVLEDPFFTGDDKLNVFVRQALTSRTVPSHPGWLDMEGIITKALEQAIYGRAAPEDALSEANAGIQRIIDKFNRRRE